ncbi:SDR family NAD(P)-dependent oxidoreductase [Paractinoplanes atraurantiacus]|uniref:Anti-anti-sigma factor n=1 Tax=Paractinoplanes atraurantiacus TaxID=1036182 RepID=A0A285EXY1_9ACTN|nr:SDR family NAD(P)-dependent oxidoreductase [Actinoplanes atraurantiacus]SNY03895.1 anti-anti-sigma factor [Actinoplanes atraurantiacus]
MNGTTALVTGASHGIGHELSRRLAGRGFRVLVHGPTPASAEKAVRRLVAAGTKAERLTPVAADFRHLEQVIELGHRVERLDLLVNNAGTLGLADPAALFQVNYLAHYALTRALGPALKASAGRVVTVASSRHRMATADLFAAGLRPAEAYANAQAARILLTGTVSSEVEAVAVHPGVVDTGRIAGVYGLGGLPVRDGAEQILWATEPGAAFENGAYYEGHLLAHSEVDVAAADRLWCDSAKILGWDCTAERSRGIRRVVTCAGYTGCMTELRCAIERDTDKAGKTTYLHLSGAFDKAAHRELRRELWGAFARKRRGRVVVDLARVDEIGSECIEVLLMGYTKALRGGHGFEVTGAQGGVRQMLEATGLCERPDDDVLYAPAWPDIFEFTPLGAPDRLG